MHFFPEKCNFPEKFILCKKKCVKIKILRCKFDVNLHFKFIQYFSGKHAFLPESVWAKGSSNSWVCHLRLSYIFTSSHLHIVLSSHLTSSHSHLHIFTYSHLLFLSLTLTSSHLQIFTLTSSHLQILTSSLSLSHTHTHIFTSSHTHIFSLSLSPLSSLLSSLVSPLSLPFLSPSFSFSL